MSILIYDDNEESLKIMESTLANVGYEIETSSDIIESIKMIESSCNKINMIITKFDISHFSLKDYLYIIRKLNKNIRVVVVSSSNNSRDELESIDLNVDEYIKKPVSTTVLKRRVERLLINNNEGTLFIKRDLIAIDTINHIVRKENTLINLSMTEYKILVYLVRNSNHVVSRQELYEKVWSDSYNINRARTIDVHISNLRGKLNLVSLYSVRGVGYKIEN